MGSWTNTCFLSHLPMPAGSPVVAFLLVELGQAPKFSPCSSYAPLGLPVTGVYDDYGGVDEVTLDPVQDALWKARDGYARLIVEREQGENPYHDLPVNFEILAKEGFAHLAERAERGRLLVRRKQFNPKTVRHDVVESPVHLAMCHQSLWEALQGASEEQSVADCLAQLVAVKSAPALSKETLAARQNDLRERLKSNPNDMAALDELMQLSGVSMSARGGLHPLASHSRYGEGDAGDVGFADWVRLHHRVRAEWPEHVAAFEHELAQMMAAHAGMMNLRRWFAPCALNHQEHDWGAHRKFLKAQLEVLEQHAFEEEEGQDEGNDEEE